MARQPRKTLAVRHATAASTGSQYRAHAAITGARRAVKAACAVRAGGRRKRTRQRRHLASGLPAPCGTTSVRPSSGRSAATASAAATVSRPSTPSTPPSPGAPGCSDTSAPGADPMYGHEERARWVNPDSTLSHNPAGGDAARKGPAEPHRVDAHLARQACQLERHAELDREEGVVEQLCQLSRGHCQRSRALAGAILSTSCERRRSLAARPGSDLAQAGDSRKISCACLIAAPAAGHPV